MTLYEARDYVCRNISCLDYLEPAPNHNAATQKGYICPACGSGSRRGSKSTGAVDYFKGTNTWACGKCQAGGSVIDWYMYKYNVKFEDALDALADRARITIDRGHVIGWDDTISDDYMPPERTRDRDSRTAPQPEKTASDANNAATVPVDLEGMKKTLQRWGDKRGYTLEAVYSYNYAGFQDGLHKAKFRTQDGEKTFIWIHPDGNKFTWEHTKTHRLYIAGDPDADTVYLCEGEKDADSLHSLTGWTAASAEDGAPKESKESKKQAPKWRKEYGEQLAGKIVYILGDNDDAGRYWMKVQAENLAPKAADVFIVDLAAAWPDCPEKGDISDLIQTVGSDKAKEILGSAILDATHHTPEEQTPEKPAVEIPEGARRIVDYNARKYSYTITACYSYAYGDFRDGLIKVCYNTSDGTGVFLWLNNQSGNYESGRKYCKNRLYIAGDPDADLLYICANEADADAIHEILDMTAAAAPDTWRTEYSEQLTGKRVFMFGCQAEAEQLTAYARHVTIARETLSPAEILAAKGKQAAQAQIEDLLVDYDRISTIKEPDTADYLAEFLEESKGGKYKPVESGVEWFDDLMHGGILRQSLVLLSAAPGSGKTALCQLVFEEIAARGSDVLYINLEMSRQQMFARSLSRISGRLIASEIMAGHRWSKEEETYINDAAGTYREQIAPHITYKPDNCTPDISSIKATLIRAGEKAKHRGEPGPAVCLDYLHLVTSKTAKDPAEIVKEIVMVLKQYAIDYNTFVIAISATNRESNKAGKISINSGRDSSGLEYTADYYISLNYTALAKGWTKPDDPNRSYNADDPEDLAELQNATPRLMQLQLVKDRMGQTGNCAYLNFDARYSAFTETTKAEQEKIHNQRMARPKIVNKL